MSSHKPSPGFLVSGRLLRGDVIDAAGGSSVVEQHGPPGGWHEVQVGAGYEVQVLSVVWSRRPHWYFKVIHILA